MKNVVIVMIIFLFTNAAHGEEEVKGGLKGEIFRAVMQDTLAQFNYHRSQTEFLFPDYKREETFFKSFGDVSYQGVIKTETLGKVEYVTNNAVIFWTSRSSSKKDSGILDMNQFVYEHHPSLMMQGENRFVCGGLCIGAIAIGIGAGACAIFNAQCNNRCAMVTCPSGSTKVCESTCATGWCGVACNHMEPDLLSIFNPPWINGNSGFGAFNASPFNQWNPYQLDANPPGGGGPVFIGQ